MDSDGWGVGLGMEAEVVAVPLPFPGRGTGVGWVGRGAGAGLDMLIPLAFIATVVDCEAEVAEMAGVVERVGVEERVAVGVAVMHLPAVVQWSVGNEGREGGGRGWMFRKGGESP